MKLKMIQSHKDVSDYYRSLAELTCHVVARPIPMVYYVYRGYQ